MLNFKDFVTPFRELLESSYSLMVRVFVQLKDLGLTTLHLFLAFQKALIDVNREDITGAVMMLMKCVTFPIGLIFFFILATMFVMLRVAYLLTKSMARWVMSGVERIANRDLRAL